MPLCINDDELLEKYKIIWIKIKDYWVKIIELNALPFLDSRYIKNKTRRFDGKFYTNFRGLNVPEDCIEYNSFTVISIGFLLVDENIFYLQVSLDNYAYKIASAQRI